MTEKFKKNVQEAKKVLALLRLQNKHRVKVAQLAVSACTIKHGGKAVFERLTVKKFAEKIGINDHTLHEWIRYYRIVYVKLDGAQREYYNEMSADQIKRIVVGLSPKTTEGKVRRTFMASYRAGPDANKFRKYVAVLDTILYHLSAHKRVIMIPDEMLFEIVKKCRTIIAYIEKEMEFREGKIPARYNKPKINFDTFWEEEVGVQ